MSFILFIMTASHNLSNVRGKGCALEGKQLHQVVNQQILKYVFCVGMLLIFD